MKIVPVSHSAYRLYPIAAVEFDELFDLFLCCIAPFTHSITVLTCINVNKLLLASIIYGVSDS